MVGNISSVDINVFKCAKSYECSCAVRSSPLTHYIAAEVVVRLLKIALVSQVPSVTWVALFYTPLARHTDCYCRRDSLASG